MATFREVLKQYQAFRAPDTVMEISLSGMGIVQLRLGNSDEARDYLERALKVERPRAGPLRESAAG